MRDLLRAALNTSLGIFLGLVLLEAVLYLNPSLLFRGMALPGPVDAPLTRLIYDVRYSDADVFHWRPDLVRPVLPENNQIEAHVELVTDEFGFRNFPPLPQTVDVVVLGRSISLAAHLSEPWPESFARKTGMRVLNLAQPGGGLIQKMEFLSRYGMKRRPSWVIVEIAPSLDILDGVSPTPYLTQEMVYPMIQGLWQLYQSGNPAYSSGHEIYPIQLDLPARVSDLTCCLHYMEFFSLDRESLERSVDWVKFRQTLLDLNTSLKARSICLALLYAPTKPEVYFPLAKNPAQLKPTLQGVIPYRLDADGNVLSVPQKQIGVETIRNNANAGRELLESFAQQNGILLIDPMHSIVQAVLDGENPFMVYDSHWNSLGHDLVAQEAASVLLTDSCP